MSNPIHLFIHNIFSNSLPQLGFEPSLLHPWEIPPGNSHSEIPTRKMPLGNSQFIAHRLSRWGKTADLEDSKKVEKEKRKLISHDLLSCTYVHTDSAHVFISMHLNEKNQQINVCKDSFAEAKL